MKQKNKQTVVLTIAFIFVAALSFYGGTTYSNSKNKQNSGTNFNQNTGGQGRVRGGAMGAGFVNGEVISKDDKSITLKMRDGSSKIIFFSPSTLITKSVPGSTDDIATSTTIMVTGKTGSDGSVIAETISLRPAGSNQGIPAQTK